MGHKGKSKRAREGKSRGGDRGGGSGNDAPAPPSPQRPHNFVRDAGPGCVIAHVPEGGAGAASSLRPPPWALGAERVRLRDYPPGTTFPDLAVDPDDGVLTVVNASESHRVFYVTVYDGAVLDADGAPFPAGAAVDNDGATRACVTFILKIPPMVMLHAATLSDPMRSEIEYDVQDWRAHPAPDDAHRSLCGFPLGADRAPYLCTQGEGGHLTHFFAGNQHAIDFRCDEGCDVLAVRDGVVEEVVQENTLTGVATRNLYKWNSVMLRCDDDDGNADADPLFVEYVHIKANSARVKVGDRVKRGDKLCDSGGVGFSPEPHLHFTAFRSKEPTAATTRTLFDGGRAGPYVPVAGRWYDAGGEVCVDGGEEEDGRVATE